MQAISVGASVILDDQFRRNLRKIKKTRRARCKICKIWVTSKKALKEHEKGKNHKKQLKGVFDDIRRCEECEIILHSNKSLDQHLAGRPHQRRVQYLFRLEEAKRIERESSRPDKYAWLVELGKNARIKE